MVQQFSKWAPRSCFNLFKEKGEGNDDSVKSPTRGVLFCRAICTRESAATPQRCPRLACAKAAAALKDGKQWWKGFPNLLKIVIANLIRGFSEPIQLDAYFQGELVQCRNDCFRTISPRKHGWCLRLDLWQTRFQSVHRKRAVPCIRRHQTNPLPGTTAHWLTELPHANGSQI